MVRPVMFWDERLNHYTYGAGHPMRPDRLRHTMHLLDHFGVSEEVDLRQHGVTDVELIAKVHSRDYIEALSRNEVSLDYGIGTVDHPLRPELAAISSLVSATTVEAARLVWEGQVERAINLAGGHHHAYPSRQSGFCVFNDAAVAITWLLEHGAQRIAYVDLDAHHGDGVESIFWDDPRVVTISVHESGIYLFPYSGFAHEIGGTDALGTAVNIALPPETSEISWLEAVHGLVPQLLRQFQPEIVISQHGSDPHARDPLSHLSLSVNAEKVILESLARWVRDFASGRWVILGGGGYDPDSVARMWTQVVATAADIDTAMSAPMPGSWEEIIASPGSPTFGDAGADDGLRHYRSRKTSVVTPEATVRATSKAIFPYWGLTPYN